LGECTYLTSAFSHWIRLLWTGTDWLPCPFYSPIFPIAWRETFHWPSTTVTRFTLMAMLQLVILITLLHPLWKIRYNYGSFPHRLTYTLYDSITRALFNVFVQWSNFWNDNPTFFENTQTLPLSSPYLSRPAFNNKNLYKRMSV
jgi:hypothetical protein